MKVVGQIKINGIWVDQDKIPDAVVKEKIHTVISAGMQLIGYELKNNREKTA